MKATCPLKWSDAGQPKGLADVFTQRFARFTGPGLGIRLAM
jgi:hypothetical protein